MNGGLCPPFFVLMGTLPAGQLARKEQMTRWVSSAQYSRKSAQRVICYKPWDYSIRPLSCSSIFFSRRDTCTWVMPSCAAT